MPEHASGYPALRPAAASLGQSASSTAPAGHSRPFRACFPAQARLGPAVDPKRSCRLNVCAGGGGAADCAPCLSACVASCGSRSCRVLRMRRVYLPSSCTQRHTHLSVCVYGLLILCRDTVLFCAAARSGLGTGALWALCARPRRGHLYPPLMWQVRATTARAPSAPRA